MTCVSDCKGKLCAFRTGLGVKTGTRQVKMNSATHAELRGFLDLQNEVGGSLRVDWDRNELVLDKVSTGKKDLVKLPRGDVQFHTHPSRCDSKATCYVELPSDADMKIAVTEGMQGVHGQLVIAHGGSYYMAMTPKLRLEAATSGPRALANRIGRSFDGRMRRWESRMLSAAGTDRLEAVMDDLRKEWIQACEQEGFAARFRPPSQAPTVQVSVLPS